MLNSVIMIGRLVEDPEARKVSGKDGSSDMVAFTIANNGYKQADGSQETNFMDVKAFGKMATSVQQYVKKGDLVAVKGRLHAYKFTNKKSQQVVKGYEIVADAVDFLESKRSPEATSASAKPEQKVPEKEAAPKDAGL